MNYSVFFFFQNTTTKSFQVWRQSFQIIGTIESEKMNPFRAIVTKKNLYSKTHERIEHIKILCSQIDRFLFSSAQRAIT